MEDIGDFIVHRNAVVFDLWHFLAEGLVWHQGEKFLAAKHNQVVDCNSVLCSHTHTYDQWLRWFTFVSRPKRCLGLILLFEFWWWFLFSLPFYISIVSNLCFRWWNLIILANKWKTFCIVCIHRSPNWTCKIRAAIQMIRMQMRMQIQIQWIQWTRTIQWIHLNQPKGAI